MTKRKPDIEFKDQRDLIKHLDGDDAWAFGSLLGKMAERFKKEGSEDEINAFIISNVTYKDYYDCHVFGTIRFVKTPNAVIVNITKLVIKETLDFETLQLIVNADKIYD